MYRQSPLPNQVAPPPPPKNLQHGILMLNIVLWYVAYIHNIIPRILVWNKVL